mmetsp:Transcript_29028/g.66462  ORF Transcript_29028/g.66462 Transcript_29028/m.66462 type:complete len:284 (+) Transcript_29028:125-976(+)
MHHEHCTKNESHCTAADDTHSFSALDAFSNGTTNVHISMIKIKTTNRSTTRSPEGSSAPPSPAGVLNHSGRLPPESLLLLLRRLLLRVVQQAIPPFLRLVPPGKEKRTCRKRHRGDGVDVPHRARPTCAARRERSRRPRPGPRSSRRASGSPGCTASRAGCSTSRRDREAAGPPGCRCCSRADAPATDCASRCSWRWDSGSRRRDRTDCSIVRSGRCRPFCLRRIGPGWGGGRRSCSSSSRAIREKLVTSPCYEYRRTRPNCKRIASQYRKRIRKRPPSPFET